MRLLSAANPVRVKFFTGERDRPPYAILSHTWLAEDEEVILTDLRDLRGTSRKPGWQKVEFARRQALADGYQWIWIDTCCIDKTSSAELSEAINSMYQWYEGAAVCYTYLNDLEVAASRFAEPPSRTSLETCRWFTRGWTLQEMLAPKILRFYDKNWNCIGTKESLGSLLATITKVPIDTMQSLENYTAASKMSWASRRICTRAEDLAYCLMGIFDVNMPLLYGEGGDRAFERLQEEIMNRTRDLSLLLWRDSDPVLDERKPSGILAKSPKSFRQCGSVVSCHMYRNDARELFQLVNLQFTQLRISLPVVEYMGEWFALLNHRFDQIHSGPIGIPLRHYQHGNDAENGQEHTVAVDNRDMALVIPASVLHLATRRRLVLISHGQWAITRQSEEGIKTQIRVYGTSWSQTSHSGRASWTPDGSDSIWLTTVPSEVPRVLILEDRKAIRKSRLLLAFKLLTCSALVTQLLIQTKLIQGETSGEDPRIDDTELIDDSWQWLELYTSERAVDQTFHKIVASHSLNKYTEVRLDLRAVQHGDRMTTWQFWVETKFP